MQKYFQILNGFLKIQTFFLQIDDHTIVNINMIGFFSVFFLHVIHEKNYLLNAVLFYIYVLIK